MLEALVLLVTIVVVALPIRGGSINAYSAPAVQRGPIDLDGSDARARSSPAWNRDTQGPAKSSSIVSQNLGGGVLTLAFSKRFPSENRSYAQTIFDLAYPELVSIYGVPAQTSQVTLDYLPGGSWDTTGCEPAPTLTMAELPVEHHTELWDSHFIHELAHAFHCGISIPYPWAEEGMATLAQSLVVQRLVESGKRSYPSLGKGHSDLASYLTQYDTNNYINPDTYLHERVGYSLLGDYGQGAAFFFILSTTVDRFLSKLNEALYSEASAYPYYPFGPSFNNARFLSVIRGIVGNAPVDGMAIDEWLDRQGVTYLEISGEILTGAAPTVGVIADHHIPNGPSFWSVDAFVIDPKLHTNIPHLDADLRVIDSKEVVAFEAVFKTGDTGISSVAIPALPDGGYKITVSANYGGQTLEAASYGIRQSVYNLGWAPDYGRCDCIFGVMLDTYGNPTSAPLETNGTLRENANGAFVIDTSSHQVAVTIGSETRVITKPGPYSRVVFLPVQTLTDFTLSVSPATAKLYGSSNASYVATISSVGGFRGAISLIARGSPAYVTSTFQPPLVYLSPSKDASISLSFSTGSSSLCCPDTWGVVGVYSVKLVAKSGPLIRTGAVTLDVEWLTLGEFKDHSYAFELLTNSSTHSPNGNAFNYNGKRQLINFTVGGPEGTSGFMNATFDAQLLSGPPMVSVDNMTSYSWSRVNATHYFVHVSYEHSTRAIIIRGSEPVPTGLNIEVSPNTVNMTRGENVTIQGVLLANGYYPLEGMPVRMEYSLNNVDWSFIALVATDASGHFRHGWLPPSIGTYVLRARWDGDSAYSNAISVSLTAQVVPEFVQPAFIAIITLALICGRAGSRKNRRC